jgi:hypothetical protein
MKRALSILMATAAIALVPTTSMAQTENPRGVYKLMAQTDKNGNLSRNTYDGYKICTDSITLMFTVQGCIYYLSNMDDEIFNYTGEEPDAHNATAIRIFNSNAEHFTQKWWSTYANHLIFPHNDWCTEYYESGKYSENAKVILDALMSPAASDSKMSIIGTWRIVGMMDELRDVKKQLGKLHENSPQRNNGYLLLTPNNAIMFSGGRGSIDPVAYEMKGKKIKIGSGQRVQEQSITWLGKDYFAMEVHIDYRTDYQIWERVSGATPLFNRIASQNVIH